MEKTKKIELKDYISKKTRPHILGRESDFKVKYLKEYNFPYRKGTENGIFLVEKGKRGVDEIPYIKIFLNGKDYECSENSLYHIIFNKIRKKLEKEGVQLMCNGTSKRFTHSGLSMSMSEGLKGMFVNLETGDVEEPGVELLDFREGEEWVNLEEQEKAIKDWMKKRMKMLAEDARKSSG